MGIITKPNTFTGQTAPQLPWLDAVMDLLYSEFNGNIDNANIKSDANISQAKILNLVVDLAAKYSAAGGILSGNPIVRNTAPNVDLRNTASTFREWLIQLDSDNIIRFYENTGSEGSPVYAGRYAISPGGVPAEFAAFANKGYVDALVAAVGPLAIVVLPKTDGDFTTSSTTFEDVPGLSTTFSSGARKHRISFIGKTNAGSAASRVASINVQVDGVDVLGTSGIVSVTSEGTSKYGNCSFSVITPNALAAGSKTIKIQMKTDAGSSILRASTTDQAVLQVEELTS